MNQSEIQTVSGISNGLIMSVVLLAKCLQSRGALPVGMYESTLKDTIADHRTLRSVGTTGF